MKGTLKAKNGNGVGFLRVALHTRNQAVPRGVTFAKGKAIPSPLGEGRIDGSVN
jgi:hypothetical protein